MASNVYFIPCSKTHDVQENSRNAAALFEKLLQEESVSLEKELPVKVHFGEMGNTTYLPEGTYGGILDALDRRGVKATYMETCVLYGGPRRAKESHIRIAKKHGFNRLPIVIADGERGEDVTEVPVHLKYFEQAHLSKALASAPQVLVLSHFKGHTLAGFGGALKQLSMGFAAKGGKLAMHTGIKPRIWSWKCKRCKQCMTRCQAGAITIGETCKIDHEKCLGCGACYSICPHHAITILSLKGLKRFLFGKTMFRERLMEYAYASHHGKRHIYVSFALNVTGACDCEPHPMLKCTDDIGIFASTDPVALDMACWDAVAAKGRKFKGVEQLAYAEKIGVGTRSYQIVNVSPES